MNHNVRLRLHLDPRHAHHCRHHGAGGVRVGAPTIREQDAEEVVKGTPYMKRKVGLKMIRLKDAFWNRGYMVPEWFRQLAWNWYAPHTRHGDDK